MQASIILDQPGNVSFTNLDTISGRVVVRYSGTEALARVMIEAEDEGRMRHHAEAIAGAIRAQLGV